MITRDGTALISVKEESIEKLAELAQLIEEHGLCDRYLLQPFQ